MLLPSFSLKETPFYGATVKIHEPAGVIGITCPNSCPLLAFVSLLAPAVIRGNTVVIIPSQKHPMIAVDMYQVRPFMQGASTRASKINPLSPILHKNRIYNVNDIYNVNTVLKCI